VTAMKIVLSSRGSRGDVHPVIEIASALKRSGHDVVICVPPLFEDIVRQKGLAYSLSAEDSGRVMQELGRGVNAIRTALDWLNRTTEDQFNFMLPATEGADALVTHVAEMAAPTVAEYRRIPHFRIAYTPVLPGRQPPPLIPWQNLPGFANCGMWHFINTATWLMAGRCINEKRSGLGLGPMGPLARHLTRSSHTILTLNRELAPPCPSWERRYRYDYTGYCYGDIQGRLAPDLERFLASGPRPVYIGFGSVHVKEPERFTDIILEAINRVGCRAVIGTGWTGLGNGSMPASVFQTGDSDHATLFPRCAGVAHHGGSGTTHTAARAGVPQFIMPQIADQYYWGHRVHALGLGPRPVRPERMTVRKFEQALRELLDGGPHASNAAELGRSMMSENGIPAVLDVIHSQTGYHGN